jgi:hypothetical protein
VERREWLQAAHGAVVRNPLVLRLTVITRGLLSVGCSAPELNLLGLAGGLMVLVSWAKAAFRARGQSAAP